MGGGRTGGRQGYRTRLRHVSQEQLVEESGVLQWYAGHAIVCL